MHGIIERARQKQHKKPTLSPCCYISISKLPRHIHPPWPFSKSFPSNRPMWTHGELFFSPNGRLIQQTNTIFYILLLSSDTASVQPLHNLFWPCSTLLNQKQIKRKKKKPKWLIRNRHKSKPKGVFFHGFLHGGHVLTTPTIKSTS